MLNMQIRFRAEVKSMVKLIGKREDLEESGSGARLTGMKVHFGSFLKKRSLRPFLILSVLQFSHI